MKPARQKNLKKRLKEKAFLFLSCRMASVKARIDMASK